MVVVLDDILGCIKEQKHFPKVFWTLGLVVDEKQLQSLALAVTELTPCMAKLIISQLKCVMESC